MMMMCARDEENKKLFFFSLSLFKEEEEEEDEPRSMDEFFVVFLGNFCRRLFFYFLEKMDQCENLWLSIAFEGTHNPGGCKKKKISLCCRNKHTG